MGRRVAVRTNYRNDALFLSRLIEAINLDVNHDEEWKRRIIDRLNEVVSMMLIDNSNS
jgi:hypothetical protein